MIYRFNSRVSIQKPSDPPRPRATLFITDRSMDVLTPFVHEFTYQAMSNDLLPIEDDTKYTCVIAFIPLSYVIDRLLDINSSPL